MCGMKTEGEDVPLLAALVVGVVVSAGSLAPLVWRRAAPKHERELAQLRLDLATATRRREISDGCVARLVQLKTSLEKDVADLRQAYAASRKDLKERSLDIAILEENSVNPRDLLMAPPVPSIDAKVAAVKNDVTPSLVLLSVGSDDKVEKGFHFSIFRGSEFVGKVVVEKVLRDSCGCRVLFTKEGLTVQQGDSAATRLQ